MVEKAVKRAIGGVIRKARSYLRQLEEESNAISTEGENGKDDQDEFAYFWLNSILTKLSAEPGCAERPFYAWGVLQAAHLGKALGLERISVMEFGVAGGNGLVALERIAARVEPIFGIHIDVFGFDTGAGLPKPLDYRDCPNLWSPGYYAMDKDKLQRRLQRAQLVLGLVEETVPKFIASKPSPVGFVSFDLDYYTSTMQAFRLLDAEEDLLLPRIHCYFDDITGFTYSDFNGERLAISDFNATHPMRKISPIYGLKHFLPPPYADSWWPEMFFMAHIFDHKWYNRNDGLVKRVVGGLTELVD
ncbi:MAG TPA: hypothetical protein VHM64_14730 [Candidatus Binatia bacterium]|nr:hypothetical protein [Candidatus Binatia bacterium]